MKKTIERKREMSLTPLVRCSGHPSTERSDENIRNILKVQGEIEFTITEHSSEHVLAEMPIHSGILNPYGIVNAGAMLWFADVCATILVNGDGEFAPGVPGFPLGVSLNAHFAGNQKDGVLNATCKFVKRDRRLSIVHTIISGANNQLIADVTTKHIAAK